MSDDRNPPPFRLCFVFLVLLFLLGLSWYGNYEPVLEDLMSQVKLFLMVSPVVLLLVAYCLSSESVLFPMGVPEQDSIHRAGGSPWGVGFLLLFLVFMVS